MRNANARAEISSKNHPPHGAPRRCPITFARLNRRLLWLWRLDSAAKLLHILKLSEADRAFVEVKTASEGEEVFLISDGTPFYALGGGQTSDRGTMKQGETIVDIFTAESSGDGIVLHRAKVRAGTLYAGHDVVFDVDRVTRLSTARNHTATHLLHAALHRVLGDGADQRDHLLRRIDCALTLYMTVPLRMNNCVKWKDSSTPRFWKIYRS